MFQVSHHYLDSGVPVLQWCQTVSVMTNVIREQYLYFSKVSTSFVLFYQPGKEIFLVPHVSTTVQQISICTFLPVNHLKTEDLKLEDTQLRGLKSRTHYSVV